MNLTVYTIILTYAMAVIGIAAASLVEGISPAFAALLGAAAAASLALNLRGRRTLPKWLWNVLAALILLLFLADYAAISKSLLVSASRFLAILTVLKLFDLKKNRDHLITYCLVFFQMLAAAASTVSISFIVILGLFVVGGIWAMIIFNIRRDWHIANPQAQEPGGMIFGARFLGFVIAAAFSTIALTFVFFFLMPRAGLGFLERKSANTLKTTGFSDIVDLGDLGALKTDPTVVMRVGIAGRMPARLIHFRGAQLDHYDGRTWSRRVKLSYPAGKDRSGRFFAGPGEGQLLEQEIVLEPLDTDVLFAASNPVYIDGKFQSMRVDQSGSLYLPSPPYSRLEYRAWSDITHPRPEYGQIPDEYKDLGFLDADPEAQRIRELAARVTEEARTERGRAVAIEGFLKTSFAYSLNPAHTGGKTPIDDFLFYGKQGYCEHYASAMVIMLRAANVPSRLVTGFLQGDWNGFGNYFVVRQEHAHSWVEAYVDGAGWETFDPTPGQGLQSYTAPSAFWMYMDMIRWRWNRNVVHFTFNDQVRIAVAIDRYLHSLYDPLRKIYLREKIHRAAGRGSRALPIAVAAAAIFIVLAVAASIILRRRKTTGRQARTPAFYAEMTRILRRRGMERGQGETPLEFARRVGRAEVTEITSAHEAERYAGASLGEPELEKVRNGLAALRKDKRADER
ncbi:MAG: DUF3488 domain-containing protein [Deltaproteobacteria bacterium]|nr:DUF3488 domain-containing protein [Deltaproteobacteria bacterium]